MNAPTNSDISPDLSLTIDVDLFDPKATYTNRQRKMAMRLRQRKVHGRPPKSRDEKFIARLGTFTMHQLIRRLKQAARASSHFKHVIARSDEYAASKYKPLHDYALMCFARVHTEIEFRTKGAE
jgi:hypothetical protein